MTSKKRSRLPELANPLCTQGAAVFATQTPFCEGVDWAVSRIFMFGVIVMPSITPPTPVRLATLAVATTSTLNQLAVGISSGSGMRHPTTRAGS